MKLKSISIKNLCSIVDCGTLDVEDLFALVGENNAGKSNMLKAIAAYSSGGAGGIRQIDFNNSDEPIVITANFHKLTDVDRRRWKKYLVEGQLILEKRIWIEEATSAAGFRLKSEYHGYEAEPKETHLSINKIIDAHGSRPKWKDIADEHELPEYFYSDGNCNKTTYTKGLAQYLDEQEVEYDDPDISETQALGFQGNVVANLPAFYFLPAITDYSDEIDKRQTSSTFRRLMGDLSDRILKNDPRYTQIQDALESISSLLNKSGDSDGPERLSALSDIEGQIAGLLRQLMPSVDSVSLSVTIDEIKDLFSAGVSLSIDDGVDTDVLSKGHGLQRCVVFALLRTLIETERSHGDDETQAIILAVEEPELYIHPQLCKLFYDVMVEFSDTDQVLYTTHSPVFVDAYKYSNVGIVSKPDIKIGTQTRTCDPDAFKGMHESKVFKGLSRFNPDVSEMFFAKRVLIVEGPEDLIAVTTSLQVLKKIRNRAEEIEWSILVAGGKDAIPFFQRVANGFGIPYSVLHDLDIEEGMDGNKRATHERTNSLIAELAGDNSVHTFPVKLEAALGLDRHFKDQYAAHAFFSVEGNLTPEVLEIIEPIFD